MDRHLGPARTEPGPRSTHCGHRLPGGRPRRPRGHPGHGEGGDRRMTSRIAIVGMACRYPDAASPRELWENALAGRRAFRRLPDERMRLADYWDPDPARPDRFYARNAAVIEGYSFDRVGHKIAGSTYRSTDLTH
ncbi:beta-ketoacyl synthase N-terminal-like domain-containing protein, partial [Streptomyces clavuligerus]|uniref:beta-ketoacyl synthase N-terminal-like domain-containing protein n=1 Tax=Streptomyces clavuligerus TaxID=1901 RepID=UPI003F685C46